MLIDNIIQAASLDSQKYRFFLCQINGVRLREITAQVQNPVYTVQLGASNTIDFLIPRRYDGKDTQYYDEVVTRNLIEVYKGEQEVGVFEIQTVSLETDGISELKRVTAYSLEIKLINKHFSVPVIDGGYKLVDNINPDRGILNLVTLKSPSWSIGTVDAELLSKVRIFDEADTNVYEFLMSTVQETYECIFEFDTFQRKIHAHYLPNYGRTSPIIVSMSNLANTAAVVESAENIITRLHLYGQNDLTVRDVNLGQDFIDNFSYYKNTRFMSQSLINALNAYDILVAANRPTYETKLGEYIDLVTQKITLESQLAALISTRDAKQKALDYAIAVNDNAQIPTLEAELASVKSAVTAKELEISTKTGQINSKLAEINTIVNTLSMENNFTEAQLIELDNFIIEDTYQDPNIMIVDSMTYEEAAGVQDELLSLGQRALERASMPRYTITMDIVDFFKIKEFAGWWNELYLGDVITIDINEHIRTQVRVTGYTHDWDNNGLTLVFSDRYSIEDPSVSLAELVQAGASAGTTINYEKFKYKKYLNEENNILNFINGALDLNKNAVVGGTNQEFKVDSSGVHLRRYDTTLGNYSPNQIKLTHNAIVLTDDSFDTAKVAIGELPTGQYGVAAEVIAGKLIMGNMLTIENDAGTLVIDEEGIHANSFNLSMISNNDLGKVLISPFSGLRFQTRPDTNSAWSDALSFDPNTKKLVIAGTLNAVDGTFSGTLNAAGGTFAGQLRGGTIGIGGASYNNFVVDSSGNVTIKQGSININNKFIVDSAGNLTATNATISGNITLGTGSTINWAQVTPPTAAQVGALPSNTYIPTLPSYIETTRINNASIETPTISAGTINGSTINVLNGLIRSTSAANGRVDITNGNIQSYNQAGYKDGASFYSVGDTLALSIWYNDIRRGDFHYQVGEGKMWLGSNGVPMKFYSGSSSGSANMSLTASNIYLEATSVQLNGQLYLSSPTNHNLVVVAKFG